MKVSTNAEVVLSFPDLENLIKKEGLVANDLTLKGVTCDKGLELLKIEFEKITEGANKENSQESDPRMDKFLKTLLSNMGITGNLLNSLNAAKIKTPKDLLEYSVEDLQKFRGVGEKSIKQLSGILKTHGLTLKKN